MRQWLRSHLTFANVVALAALFVALGGTAMASVIITSNGQVAQGTISGHNQPNGYHPNIVLNSLNGADIKESTLTGTSRTLSYNAAGSSAPVHKRIATVGPYTLKASCERSRAQLKLFLYANGPAGTATLSPMPANTDVGIGELGAARNVFDNDPNQEVSNRSDDAIAWLQSGSTVVQVEYEALVHLGGDAGYNGQCTLVGLSTVGT